MENRPVFHPNLGEFFRDLREQKGWRQAEAAHFAERRNLSAVTRQVILRLEKGKTKNPEPEVLRAISELYGVPYEELVARCVRSQYDVEVRPAKPGETHPEINVTRALSPDEELLLGLYNSIEDKAQRREFLKMLAVARDGLLARAHAESVPTTKAAGAERPAKVLPLRRKKTRPNGA